MSYYLTQVLKIGKYCQKTSVSVSYIYRKYIYSVEYLSHCEWFDNLEEAIHYSESISEYLFFCYPSFIANPKVRITEYTVNI